jgi:membrane associated rhomboid family serine protease
MDPGTHPRPSETGAATGVTPPAAGGESPPAELAEVGVYAKPAQGFERGLVVLSMGLAYWLLPVEGGYKLFVESPFASRVRRELSSFERESADWPPRPAVERAAGRESAMLTPLIWALAVLAIFNLQGAGIAGQGRWAMDGRALFRHGEWWRPFTALFLHADAGHLTANLIFGFFVFTAVVSTLGVIRGWLLLAAAAVAANVGVAAVTFPAPYQSLGASTAIFAGFGLLTGRAIRVLRRASGHPRWHPVVIPLASGIALLGLLGTGGGDTDVAAHLAGFAAGGILGLAAPGPLPGKPV